ncbi:hypothetical protein DW133_01090 [Sutterella sp. AM11-39]|nr:hypothetical protein DW133_01090 [Sutterella sp. AM11-39]
MGALVRSNKVLLERTAQFFQKTILQLSPMESTKRDNEKAGSVKESFFLTNDSDKPAFLIRTSER